MYDSCAVHFCLHKPAGKAFPLSAQLRRVAFWFVRNWLLTALLVLALHLLTLCHLAAQPRPKPAGTKPGRLTDYVNPFIGTGGHGHTFPGATRPWGLVQLSPDTYDSGWDWCSGYQYSDASIMGFSHTHLSGTGVADLGDVLLMPNTGPVQFAPGSREKPDEGYRSRFSHAREKASPGYYSVFLDDPQVQVELTATARAGLHRYTFTKGSEGHVILDLKHGLDPRREWVPERVLNSRITLENDSTVSGFRISAGWAQIRPLYFVLQFSRPVAQYGYNAGGRFQPGQREYNGEGIQMAATFTGLDKGPLLIKIGFSTVSVANARQNLAAELPGWHFDEVREQARQDWENRLARVSGVDGTADQKTIFYTALYHNCIAPNVVSDPDGSYFGSDYRYHTGQGDYYSTFSLWDTFRATHPLLTLLEPDRDAAMVRAMLAHHAAQGYLPVWTLWGTENHCMIGNHAIPVIVDAWRKGLLTPAEAAQAYDAVRETSTRPHQLSPWPLYNQLGYMPSEVEVNAVSNTLEISYDDWCVAEIAHGLGKTEDEVFFRKRSQNYRHLYDSAAGFFRGKTGTGQWSGGPGPFDPIHVDAWGDFTEGTPWQWLWYVPHDVPGLAQLLGGPARFAQRLDTLFAMSPRITGELPDVTGQIGQYAHGNEPSHHIAYLYNYVGQPWKAQARLRQLLDHQYRNAPDGLSGNEDCGQMSAWYVFSALGLYPVNPANGRYVFGSPLLRAATLHVGAGRQFRIRAPKASSQNKYIQGVRLNGRPYAKTYVTHADVVAGGELVFEMGPKPNTRFGTTPADAPTVATTP